MKISTLFYTFKRGLANVFHNGWYTLASIATIGACLFLFGLFFSILTNVDHIVHTAEEGISVTCFFQEGTEDAVMQQVGERIRLREEVKDAVFVSADETWEEVKKDYFKEHPEYAEGFPENPLTNSAHYEIYVNDISKQADLVAYLKAIPEIRKVNQSEITANTLSGVNAMIAYASVAIIVILFAVSIFLISNTVNMGIEVRKEEIEIMKYIGATDFFVRAPFVIEGILIGLVGAVIPLACIYFAYTRVIQYIEERFAVLTQVLHFLPVETIFAALLPVALGMGVGIGFLGSFVTVRKHLRV